jgi:hypothetical protein
MSDNRACGLLYVTGEACLNAVKDPAVSNGASNL